MSYSFTLASSDAQLRQIAAVRDEIDDVTVIGSPEEGKNYFLSDERIMRRLADATREGRKETHIVKMAAASALDTLATNQAYVLKVGQTLGESRDGGAVAAAIRAHAKTLRNEVVREEAQAALSVEEVIPSSQSVRVVGCW